VPYSCIVTYAHDFPYLYSRGFVAISLDTLDSWELSAPHLYLSLRLSYDPRLDPWALMADYWHKMYGPAAEAMEQYWMEIDAAFVNLSTEAGGIHAMHHVYTPERLERLDGYLKAAQTAAADRPEYLDRIATAWRGYRRATYWRAYTDAMHRGDFPAMQTIFEAWDRFVVDSIERGNTMMFARGERMGLGVTGFSRLTEVLAPADAPPRRIAAVLPDEWKTATGEAITSGSSNPWDIDFDDSGWRTIKTFSDTRNAQNLPPHLGDMWYRVHFTAPETTNNLWLYFVKADRRVTLFVDGKRINETSVESLRGCTFDVTGHIHPGQTHQIAVTVEHPSISELYLGGIVHPIYLIESN